MQALYIVVFPDGEQWRQITDRTDEIELMFEFEYEPADPAVGVMRESFILYTVTTEAGISYSQSDLPVGLWATLEELLREEAAKQADKAALEKRIAYYDWKKYYGL